MLTEKQIKTILDKQYEYFVLNTYDDYASGFERTCSKDLHQALMFEDYASTLSNADVAEWIYPVIDDDNADEDTLAEDIKKLRATIKDGINTVVDLVNKAYLQALKK